MNPMGISTGTGSVAYSTIGPGCRQYMITCNEKNPPNGKAVVIGANEAAISLTPPTPGEKMATLICNDMGQIEGRTDTNAPVIVTSAYCSVAN
uniref:Uncharacterized protein n=1 Tax=Panagrolaimus davidi TaxID=227884 RepID=A0A914PGJ3_9BILA